MSQEKNSGKTTNHDLGNSFNIPKSDDSSSKASNDTGSECYRLGQNPEQISALEIQKAGKELFLLPYSYQPIIHYTPETGLLIKTMQYDILIKGHGNFTRLAREITKQKVIWIKEATNEKVRRDGELFIKEIIIMDKSL